MKMIAKLLLLSVVAMEGGGRSAHFRPVSDSGFDGEGNAEDSSFSNYTPSGDITLHICNDEIELVAGEKYFVPFILDEGEGTLERVLAANRCPDETWLENSEQENPEQPSAGNGTEGGVGSGATGAGASGDQGGGAGDPGTPPPAQ